MDVPNVTVTVLPASLSLVHIPRYRLNHFAHPIIKQILWPNPTFLNISCNPTEVSIIAERSSLSSFARIAKKDEKRIQRAARQGRSSTLAPVVVSSSWSALQIDSHGDQLGDASDRIREISALLSGISILYQSSYTTDFIFVQSSKLSKVLSILRNAGFLAISTASESSDENDLSSQFYSLTCSSTSSLNTSSDSDELAWPYWEDSASNSILLGTGQVDHQHLRHSVRLGSSGSASQMSVHSLLFSKTTPGITSLEPVQHILANPPPIPTEIPPQASEPRLESSVGASSSTSKPRPSPRTPIPVVEVVPPDIAVVGLSEQCDHAEAWTMKLIKLLLFPETLQRSPRSRSSGSSPSPVIGLGLSRTESSGNLSSSSSSLASDSDDGEVDDSDEENDSSGSSCSGSSRPSHVRGVQPPLRTSQLPKRKNCPLQSSSIRSRGLDEPLSFFSLTRTADGTSLATDIRLLAELFPPNDRYLVFCADEFQRIERVNHQADSGYFEDIEEVPGFLKCLHIDLAAFPLDKHGFVNRFSNILHKNSINHLYSSTFKTANLLVNQADVAKAKALLREC